MKRPKHESQGPADCGPGSLKMGQVLDTDAEARKNSPRLALRRKAELHVATIGCLLSRFNASDGSQCGDTHASSNASGERFR
jgi:hypothetical protein